MLPKKICWTTIVIAVYFCSAAYLPRWIDTAALD